MIPRHVLFELCELVFAPWGYSSWYPSAPATESSIARISEELKIAIPADFIALSQNCAPYGGWFGSIGEDFSSHNHIIKNNRSFRRNDEDYKALPPHLVMLNHGHDGDCDCWNTQRHPNENGEFSIVYFNATSGEICNPEYDFPTFAVYLEHLCRAQTKSLAMRPFRKRIGEDAQSEARRKERYEIGKARHEKTKELLAPYEANISQR